jgi:hypothetical protein
MKGAGLSPSRVMNRPLFRGYDNDCAATAFAVGQAAGASNLQRSRRHRFGVMLR